MPLIFLLTKNTPRLNFKITSIMNEKRILWRKQIAAILDDIMKKHPYSQECVDCSTENQFFDDSCNFVAIHHELVELRQLLLRLNRYEEICKDC